MYNVELINNPYAQRMRILINGEAVSVYSNLERYREDSFGYWCDKIFDAIYEECNESDFNLHFSSRDEEIEIMSKLAGEYPHCVSFTSSQLIRSTPLTKRMIELNKIIKQLPASEYNVYRKSLLFIISEDNVHLKTDLEEMEVKNSFCDISSSVILLSDYARFKPKSDFTILITDEESYDYDIRRSGIERDCVISIGERNGFRLKQGDYFNFDTDSSHLFDTIFNYLMLYPLLGIFKECIESLPERTKRRFQKEIELLQSVSYKVVPIIETEVLEAGKSYRIGFESDLPGYIVRHADLHFSYSKDNIIRCNGMLVEAIKPGLATLKIYKEGEMFPSATVDFEVIKRNRITKISIEDDSIVLGENDKIKLNYSYLPVDADNIDSIEWESDNDKVIKAYSDGTLHAVKSGVCTVRCIAEQVSASCRCTVKPHLKAIETDVPVLDMTYGAKYEVNIKIVPNNCMDGQLVYSSNDMNIANIAGGVISAVGYGTTTIIIQNKQKTVKTHITVNVMNEKEFKKKHKQKRGLFSNLFG